MKAQYGCYLTHMANIEGTTWGFVRAFWLPSGASVRRLIRRAPLTPPKYSNFLLMCHSLGEHARHVNGPWSLRTAISRDLGLKEGATCVAHPSMKTQNDCTAVLPKIPHSNCCKRVPNRPPRGRRPLRGRRGRFGTLLQLLECGIFGRTAVGASCATLYWSVANNYRLRRGGLQLFWGLRGPRLRTRGTAGDRPRFTLQYSQSSMMAHPYGTNCTCQHYCHSQC